MNVILAIRYQKIANKQPIGNMKVSADDKSDNVILMQSRRVGTWALK